MKPALVFIHGLGGSSDIWLPQQEHFEHFWQTLAWAPPGYAGKPLIKPLTFDAVADALMDDLDLLAMDRVVLIGHSLGGMIAQTAVARAPRRVAALVLSSTSPAFGDPKGEFQQRFVQERLGPLDQKLTMQQIAGPAAAAMAGDNPDPAGIAAIQRAMASTPPDTFRAYVELLTSFDARATLPNIECPTLVVVGEHDRAAPPIVSEKMAQKIRGARYELVPGAGHLLPFERPETFNTIVERFLVENAIGK